MGIRVIQTNNFPMAVEEEEWRCCTVLPFGVNNAPCIATQGQVRILEVSKGDVSDTKEASHFNRLILNLPFSPEYETAFPRVMLIREDGELVIQEATFVDDIHVACRAKDDEFDHALSGCKQLEGRMNSLGNQADDRKY